MFKEILLETMGRTFFHVAGPDRAFAKWCESLVRRLALSGFSFSRHPSGVSLTPSTDNPID